jgi:hypothetical protein
MTDVMLRLRDANPVNKQHLAPSIEGVWRKLDHAVASDPAVVQRQQRLRSRVLVVAATVAVGFVVVWGFAASHLSTSQASAATVLREAAEATQAHATVFPNADQFFYEHDISSTLVPICDSHDLRLSRCGDAPHASVIVELSRWISPSRVGEREERLVAVTFPSAAARTLWKRLGRPNLAARFPITGPVPIPARLTERIPLEHGSLSTRELLALPTQPYALYKRLFVAGTADNALELVVVIDRLAIGSKLRAAIYRALALVPGIQLDGDARTLKGRIGTAIGAPLADGARDELIIDPHTGTLLGSQQVVTNPGRFAQNTDLTLPSGTVYTQTDILQRTITDTPGPRPAST